MTSRLRSLLASLPWYAWFAAVGLVAGFCLGGHLGPHLFGSLGGHGLGDLGYLFGGALLGLVAGPLLVAFGLSRWSRLTLARVTVFGTLGTALLALGTASLGWL